MSERSKTALLIGLFFLSLYLLTAKGYIKHFDNETVYQVTRSIVERGEVSVEREFAGGIVGSRGHDGDFYSKFEIGQSILILPLYLAGKAGAGLFPGLPPTLSTRFACSLLNQFITAVTCAVIYLFCVELGYRKTTSIALAFLYGAGTMAWIYSKTLFREPVIALFFLLGAFYAIRYCENRRLRTVLACGSCVAAAMLLRVDSLLAAVIIGAYILFASLRRGGRLRGLLAYAGPVCGALAINFAYNWARYGSVWITGYEGQHHIDTGFSTPFLAGLYGLLLSSGRSVFIYSPVLVLFLPAVFFFCAERRKEAVLFIPIIVLYTCFYAKWWCWYGGWCWGPRFLLPLIPFAVIPIGSLLERRKGHLVSVVIVAVIAVSLGVQLLSVSVSEMRFFQAVLFSWEVDDEVFSPMGQVSPDVINFNPSFCPLLAQWRSFLHCSWEKLPVDLRNPSVLEDTSFRRRLERGPDMWWAYCYRLGLPPYLSLSAVVLVVICALTLLSLARRLR